MDTTLKSQSSNNNDFTVEVSKLLSDLIKQMVEYVNAPKDSTSLCVLYADILCNPEVAKIADMAFYDSYAYFEMKIYSRNITEIIGSDKLKESFPVLSGILYNNMIDDFIMSRDADLISAVKKESSELFDMYITYVLTELLRQYGNFKYVDIYKIDFILRTAYEFHNKIKKADRRLIKSIYLTIYDNHDDYSTSKDYVPFNTYPNIREALVLIDNKYVDYII